MLNNIKQLQVDHPVNSQLLTIPPYGGSRLVNWPTKRTKKKMKNNRISCAGAHKIASVLHAAPAEVGRTIDLLEARIVKCQLGLFGYAPGDYTPNFNGTSSACPHVAGLAGLILSMNPCLTNLH